MQLKAAMQLKGLQAGHSNYNNSDSLTNLAVYFINRNHDGFQSE